MNYKSQNSKPFDDQIKQDSYPENPENEDNYNHLEKESNIDPENNVINREVFKIRNNNLWNENSFDEDNSGKDLNMSE